MAGGGLQLDLASDDGTRTEDIHRALIVRQPWAGMIASGTKRWEIRGRSTAVRGRIAIAAAGTGTIIGVCTLSEVVGPLAPDAYRDAWQLFGAGLRPDGPPPYPRTYAWVLADARPILPPVGYLHPAGAVIWVRLTHDVESQIQAALRQPPAGASAGQPRDGA